MTEQNNILNSIKAADEYLNTVHHIDKTLVGDPTKVVVKSQYGFTMKEIICNLLAGKGLKLPNIQVCVSVNLKAILGVPNLPEDLKAALEQLNSAFDDYLEHTSFNALMNRINQSVNEISQIANMVNFCANPIQPVPIPNVLENIMDSYLGAGKDLIDQIGKMAEPGGCLGFNGQEFNTTIFNEGILKDISDKWDKIKDGSIPQNEINALVSSIKHLSNEVNQMMTDENSFVSFSDSGGSDFPNDSSPSNLGMGVMFDAQEAGVQGVANMASMLKSSYDQLAGYPVVGKDGTVYNNIFETFLEPGLIDLLKQSDAGVPTISETVPIYNYCGEIVGYTEVVEQSENLTSNGSTPTQSTAPGAQAKDLINSDPFGQGAGSAGSNSSSGSDTVVNIVNESSASGLTGSVTTTPTDITTAVSFSGSTALPILNNTAWFMTVKAVGKKQSEAGAIMIERTCLVDKTNGTVNIVGSDDNLTVQKYNMNDSSMFINASGNQVQVFVSGEKTHSVKWTVEITHISA